MASENSSSPKRRRRGRDYNVTVRAARYEEPDVHRMARALLAWAIEHPCEAEEAAEW